MEERDDLEQMAFIQKWNDGKTEREKKREQMWNGILEKAGIKKEENTFVIIYCPDEDDDWKDPAVWYKASPNISPIASPSLGPDVNINIVPILENR